MPIVPIEQQVGDRRERVGVRLRVGVEKGRRSAPAVEEGGPMARRALRPSLPANVPEGAKAASS